MSDPTTLAITSFVNAEELVKDVSINSADISGEMVQHAQKFVHYAVLSASARAQHERLKTLADIIESKLYAAHRELMTADDKKKPTEAQIDAAVKADPRWFSIQQKVIEAKAISDLAGDAREAFKQREGMLIQVAADQRREREGELRMGSSKSVADDLRKDVLKIIAQNANQAEVAA